MGVCIKIKKYFIIADKNRRYSIFQKKMTNSKSKITGKGAGIEGRNPTYFPQPSPPMVYNTRTFSAAADNKKYRSKVQTTPITSSQLRGTKPFIDNKVLRLSPTSSLSPGSTSPRTSPGLLCGHFAGGKWSEPPSPCDVPIPPQQWTQLFASAKTTASIAIQKQMPSRQCYSKRTDFAMHDVAQHLKMLLKVQA